jgi:uncharacterized membrane protein
MVFTKLDAHYKLLISVLVALLIFWAGQDRLSSPTQFILTWIGFSFVMNALSWLTICLAHPLEMKKIAKVQDSNRTIIFYLQSPCCTKLFVCSSYPAKDHQKYVGHRT